MKINSKSLVNGLRLRLVNWYMGNFQTRNSGYQAMYHQDVASSQELLLYKPKCWTGNTILSSY